jgi:hypothetical protein
MPRFVCDLANAGIFRFDCSLYKIGHGNIKVSGYLFVHLYITGNYRRVRFSLVTNAKSFSYLGGKL